ncbi:MAG: YHS domain-containing protein, partial [Proteobacteria bacterium]|nr:YHS domain-containing protein [Pseudomonadota bacterium]
MKVAPGKKDLAYTYQMRTYYFCAESCLKSFEAN